MAELTHQTEVTQELEEINNELIQRMKMRLLEIDKVKSIYEESFKGSLKTEMKKNMKTTIGDK